MSTASREEAIEILAKHIDRALAESLVDKLLETHSIVRNAPRVHRPASDEHPKAQLARAGR